MMRVRWNGAGRVSFGIACYVIATGVNAPPANAVKVTGEIRDAGTKEIVPARLYVEDGSGTFYFADSTSSEGSAVRYDKVRGESVEKHTTLSAHLFMIELPPGDYTFTAERGKEYFTATKTLNVESDPTEVILEIERWVDMASLGYYSGDTHVHRTVAELPNVMLAEDLNVAFPLTYWVWDAYKAPVQHDKTIQGPVKAEPVYVDRTHVFYPMNTEFEIGKVDGNQHTLGAFFALNHKTPFEEGVPPVATIPKKTHSEGGLLELDKHNWPWSMMLVPTMGIDLYELTNNHIWRTNFLFKDFGVAPPAYMNIETDAGGMTEEGWIDFGFQNYYALLNCGFRLRPTAGTASGVHPVPLGFGRVYVQIDGAFSYEKWLEGLNAGRSLVTTGPMILVKFNVEEPGLSQSKRLVRVTGSIKSANPIDRFEIVLNGRVFESIDAESRRTIGIDYATNIDSTSWVAVRCYETTPEGRIRFAHTAPFFVEVPGRPLQPRKEEIEYLIGRMEEEIKRNRGVLNEASVAEYEGALGAYQTIRERVD